MPMGDCRVKLNVRQLPRTLKACRDSLLLHVCLLMPYGLSEVFRAGRAADSVFRWQLMMMRTPFVDLRCSFPLSWYRWLSMLMWRSQ